MSLTVPRHLEQNHRVHNHLFIMKLQMLVSRAICCIQGPDRFHEDRQCELASWSAGKLIHAGRATTESGTREIPACYDVITTR